MGICSGLDMVISFLLFIFDFGDDMNMCLVGNVIGVVEYTEGSVVGVRIDGGLYEYPRCDVRRIGEYNTVKFSEEEIAALLDLLEGRTGHLLTVLLKLQGCSGNVFVK